MLSYFGLHKLSLLLLFVLFIFLSLHDIIVAVISIAL